jgi:hypothetical protein
MLLVPPSSRWIPSFDGSSNHACQACGGHSLRKVSGIRQGTDFITEPGEMDSWNME